MIFDKCYNKNLGEQKVEEGTSFIGWVKCQKQIS